MTPEQDRAGLLDSLVQVADIIHDQLADFRFRVRSLMNSREISDSEAAEAAADVSSLRDQFEKAYGFMQLCEEQLDADDADYKGLRARLIEDFRQLNIIERDFERNRERPAGEREHIPELDEQEEPEEEDATGEEPEGPDEGPGQEDAEDGAAAKKEKARQSRKKQETYARQAREREEASHREAQQRADAEAARRRDTEAAEQQRRAQQEQAFTGDAGRAEQDRRLAQEAEDKAHREARIRTDAGPSDQAPSYGYTGPSYGPRYDTPEPEREKYSRELHEELVDKYRERVENFEYSGSSGQGVGYAPVWTPSPSPDRAAEPGPEPSFHMPPPPYREPVGQSPVGQDSPVWSSTPVVDGAPSIERPPAAAAFPEFTAPALDVRGLASARDQLNENMAAMERPSVQGWMPDTGAEAEAPIFKPRDSVHESAGDLMREARRRVAGIDVPDVSKLEAASSGGCTFSLHGADARNGNPSFVPFSGQDGQAYAPSVGAYVPTFTQRPGQGADPPPVQRPRPDRPDVQAAFGGQVSRVASDGAVSSSPVSSWAAPTETLKYTGLPKDGGSPLAGLTRNNRSLIYGIVSADGKQVYIDHTAHGRAEEAYRAHAGGCNPVTAGMFQADAAKGAMPRMLLLAEYQGRAGSVSQPVQAIAKRCQDSGMQVSLAGGAIGRLALDNLPKGSLQIYESLSGTPARDLMTGGSSLLVKQQAGLFGAKKAGGNSFVIEKINSRMPEHVGASDHKGESSKGASDKKLSQKAGRTRDAAPDSRADSVNTALAKFQQKSNPARSAVRSVREAFVGTLTQGDESENPFIGAEKYAYNAHIGLNVARAAALPVTVNTTKAAAATGALLEKSLYRDLSRMDTRALTSLYNKTSADVSRLTAALDDAKGATSSLKEQLREARASLVRMDNFRALQARNTAAVEASKAMSESRGLFRHNLARFDRSVAGSATYVRNTLATAPEFEGLRTRYGKDLLKVSDQKLAVAMEDLKANGRKLRGQIKDVKRQIKSAGDAATARRLTADLRKLEASSKSNARNFNAHKRLMEKRGELDALKGAAGKAKAGVLRTREIARIGSMAAAGLFVGYIRKASVQSGDLGLAGIGITYSSVTAARMGAGFIGRTTGLSRVTAGLRQRARNAVSNAVYTVTAPVRKAVNKAVSTPVKTAAKAVANSAVSAAAHGTSVIARHAASAISQAAPAGFKTAARAGTGTARAGIAAVRKAANKAASAVSNSAVGRAAKAVGHAVGRVVKGVQSFFGALGAIGGLLVAVLGWFLLIYVLLLVLVSIIPAKNTAADGKIDLSDFNTAIMDTWHGYETFLNNTLPSLEGCERAVVTMDGIPGNKKEILSMMSVRFGQDLDGNEGLVTNYLEYLTEAMNPYTADRQLEYCSGCETGYDGDSYCPGHWILYVTVKSLYFDNSSGTLQLSDGSSLYSLSSADGYGDISGIEFTGWDDPDNLEWADVIFSQDWTDLYSGITGVTEYDGHSFVMSDVSFIPGDRPGNQALVDYALSFVGEGGSRFYTWYGFPSRVEWCACFVSYISAHTGNGGAVPAFASINWGAYGINWYRGNGAYASRSSGYKPAAGDVIFFDWDGDNSADHVGYVIGTDGSYVYTVEGNSGDRVCTRSYPLTSSNVMGYGLPDY